MRSLLLALLVLSAPVCAQTYDQQKTALGAPHLETLNDVRARARLYLGKTIEVRGTVKGVVGRGDNFAALLELSQSQTLLVDAPASLRAGILGRIGAKVRVLARVDAVVNQDPTLTVQFVDAAPTSNGPVAFTLPTDGSIVPAEVLIGPDAEFAPTRPGAGLPMAPPRTSSSPRTLSSRSLPSPRAANRGRARSSTNPYFGFTEESRAAYANLARRHNPRLSPEMADYIAASILSASQTHNLDPRFLASVVQVESAFNPYAVSHAGARGLGQLMPFNLAPLGVGNAYDPMQNLHGAAKMLRQNLNTYANQPDGTLLAVAAYHAGVGAVRRAGYKIPKLSTHRYAWKVYYAYRALAPELF